MCVCVVCVLCVCVDMQASNRITTVILHHSCCRDKIGKVFYEHLFSMSPNIAALFSSTDKASQAIKFSTMLNELVLAHLLIDTQSYDHANARAFVVQG